MQHVFLVEEESMRRLLNHLLPRYLPEGSWQVIPHEGKSDLQRSIPRKLRAWRAPETTFVVLHDKHSEDCIRLKHCLRALCQGAGRGDAIIRIVCEELEAWYFGDLQAVSEAYSRPELTSLALKPKFRDPDAIVCPSAELSRRIPEFGKVSAADRVGALIDPARSTSKSFAHLIATLQSLGRNC